MTIRVLTNLITGEGLFKQILEELEAMGHAHGEKSIVGRGK